MITMMWGVDLAGAVGGVADREGVGLGPRPGVAVEVGLSWGVGVARAELLGRFDDFGVARLTRWIAGWMRRKVAPAASTTAPRAAQATPGLRLERDI
jgi:hypothetical protein